MKTPHVLLLAAFAASPSVACALTPGDDDVDQVEAAKRVKPVGTQAAGTLRVSLPAELSVSSLATDGFRIELSARQPTGWVPVALDTEVALAPGATCLRLRVGKRTGNDEDYAEGATDCTVTVAPNAVTPITLGAVRYESSDEILGVSPDVFKAYRRWGAMPEPRPTCERAKIATGDESQLIGCGVEASKLRPVLPGTYSFRWGVADGFTTTIAPGEVRVLDFASAPDRRITRVVAPTRELPDASGLTSYEIVAGAKKMTRTAAAEQSFQVGVAADANVPHVLAIVSAAARQETPLPVPAAAGAPARFEIQRIDVDHVEVTSSFGTTSVPGSYVVSRREGASLVPIVLAPDGWPTNTGLDLLPGIYQVTTTFRRLDGTAGTDVQDVTLP
jgi:hypothetical protein